MAGDGSQHFSLAANYTPFCNLPNCPHCYVNLPHNATPAMVERRCYEISEHTRVQIHGALLIYGQQINSIRAIMNTLRPASRLPVGRSVHDQFDDWFVAQYQTFMRPHADSNQLPGRGVSASSAAGADWWNATAGPSASGSVGSTTRDSRYMDGEEYPRWEFHGGKVKKLKWMAYYREPCEMLEAAFQLHYKTVTLTIDDWQYEIDLVNMKQRSVETDTCRDVRRLTGPPAA
jgi:hypothetical protein